MPHEKPEYEFMAKRALDAVVRELPDKGAVVFVADFGAKGHVGYLSNIRRADSVSLILEWLTKAMAALTKEQAIEILEKIRNEWE